MAAAQKDKHPLDASICGCGTCRQAFAEELANLQAIIGRRDANGKLDRCIHWYVARALAASAMVRMMIAFERTQGYDKIEPRMQRTIDLLTENDALDEIMPQMLAILEKPGVVS